MNLSRGSTALPCGRFPASQALPALPAPSQQRPTSVAAPANRMSVHECSARREHPLRARSTQTSVETTPTTQKAFDINERVEFLKKDLKHLFDDVGIDSSSYDDVVDFRDPITKYSSLKGYLFNIQMLKRVFKPTLELHDILVINPQAIVSRWTMTMDFMPAKFLPTAGIWSPKIIFSGTSTYGFNPANGKINLHVDTWDSIKNQAFFSLEAVADFFRQLSATYSIPKDLETPQYTVLRRASDYQVRRYAPFLVAETPMDAARAGQPSQPKQFNPAGSGFQSFNTLARYIFGGNEQKEKMEMTTPVFSDTKGGMQFVIGPSAHKDLKSVPKPLPGAAVTARMEPECVCAVRTFGGIADERNSEQEAQELIKSLERDGLLFERNAGWRLARYNDPGTLPPFRLNEILVTLSEPYDLWKPGELDAVVKGAGFQPGEAESVAKLTGL